MRKFGDYLSGAVVFTVFVLGCWKIYELAEILFSWRARR